MQLDSPAVKPFRTLEICNAITDLELSVKNPLVFERHMEHSHI